MVDILGSSGMDEEGVPVGALGGSAEVQSHH